jgi:hypothetical protein
VTYFVGGETGCEKLVFLHRAVDVQLLREITVKVSVLQSGTEAAENTEHRWFL